MASAKALEDRISDKAPSTQRTIYRYTVPAQMAKSAGVKQLGMVQLTTAEELRATKRARTDTHRLAYELTKQALVEVDGKTLSEADGSADKMWDALPPKLRNLALTAFGSLHTPEEDDIDSFLKSQVASVG